VILRIFVAAAQLAAIMAFFRTLDDPFSCGTALRAARVPRGERATDVWSYARGQHSTPSDPSKGLLQEVVKPSEMVHVHISQA